MEDGIVTVMGSLALGATIFAIVLGLGKKYHDEDQQKFMDGAVDVNSDNHKESIAYVTLDLDRDTELKLIEYACENKLLLSEVVELALEKYVELHKAKNNSNRDKN